MEIDSKLKRGSFIGHETNELGYRCHDHDARKTFRSRDVVFNEDVFYYDWSKEVVKEISVVDVAHRGGEPSKISYPRIVLLLFIFVFVFRLENVEFGLEY